MRKYFLLIVMISGALITGCKSSDVNRKYQSRYTQQPQENIPVPPEVVQKGQGLTSTEMNTLYSYALDMSYLQCERMGLEVTVKNNVDNAKEKIAEIDPKIDLLQQEIDEYLSGDARRLEAYQQAMKDEMSKCEHFEGEWFK